MYDASKSLTAFFGMGLLCFGLGMASAAASAEETPGHAKADAFAGLGAPLSLAENPDRYRAFGTDDEVELANQAMNSGDDAVSNAVGNTMDALGVTITSQFPGTGRGAESTRMMGLIPAQAIGTRDYVR